MRLFLFILFLCGSLGPPLLAQNGGKKAFVFLEGANSPRIAALGLGAIAVRDDDGALAFANPALLNGAMHQSLTFAYNFHLADIGAAYFSYAHHFEKPATTFHLGIQQYSYGDINHTDIYGTQQGTFKASDFALVLGAGKEFYGKLTIGMNAKLLHSQLESYKSTALATDIAATLSDTTHRIVASVVFKNIGVQLTHYRDQNKEPLPFEIQLGISKRLQYLPFRIGLTYRYFNQWNILYDDPDSEETTLFFGETPLERSPSAVFFDNLFRHFIFNGEFLLGKYENLRLRFGYNHLRRKELTVEGLRGLSGFSFGFGFKVNRFRVDYGKEIYHLAGGTNHIGISTNLANFR